MLKLLSTIALDKASQLDVKRSICALCLLSFTPFAGCAGPENAPEDDAIRIELPPGEVLPGDFVQVVGVRVLSDGSVLVADRGTTQLLRLLPESGQVEELGSIGDGPGEFRGVSGLFRLGGDSTALYDAAGMRLLFLEGGNFSDGTEGVERTVLGMDTIGHRMVGHFLPPSPPSDRGVRYDSILVELVDPVTGSARHLGRLQVGTRISVRINDVRHVVLDPLSIADHMVMLPDGWTALVQAEPYRVHWTDPAGATIEGQPLTHERAPLGDSARLALAQQYGIPPFMQPHLNWPDQSLPFAPLPGTSRLGPRGVAIPAPNGGVLVRRMPLASEVRYDLIDRSGSLSGFFLLEASDVVVGSDTDAIFVTSADELGVLSLRRIPWPN